MTLEQQLINKGMQQGMQKIRQIQDLNKLKVIMETILRMDDVAEVEKQVYH